MEPSNDTIVALATAAGTSAIAVVRISGPSTLALVKALIGEELPARRLRRFDYRDRTGTVLDDVLGVYFAGPHSYSGEDAMEISGHGNPYVVQRILEDLVARGCRLAEPGEFTQRAFLNGRMDLSQAEAVADLVHARSELALKAANLQLRGALGRHVALITDRLVRVLAHVEAYIDFPEEDLPVEDRQAVVSELRVAREETRRLLATQHYGSLLRDGIKTVIVGAPNVGKSSLLNKLIGRERAIVSPLPGTTRDFIEEPVMLGPHCLRLIDTAGLNAAPGAIEGLGIEKTYEKLEEADLVLAVLDASAPSPSLPDGLASRLDSKTTILVANKVDLGRGNSSFVVGHHNHSIVLCSAKTGAGIEELTAKINLWADSCRTECGDDLIAVNARHALALEGAQNAMAGACSKLEDQGPLELVASDLRGALEELGSIGGRIDNEQVLDVLFATFCIGK